MNTVVNHIKIKPKIKVQPITLVDTLEKDEAHFESKNLFSKVLGKFFAREDLNFEEWQRLEAKPNHKSRSDSVKHHYSRGFK